MGALGAPTCVLHICVRIIGRSYRGHVHRLWTADAYIFYDALCIYLVIVRFTLLRIIQAEDKGNQRALGAV